MEETMKQEEYIETIKRLQNNAERISVFDDHDDIHDMLFESLKIAEAHNDTHEWLHYADLLDHMDGLYNGYKQMSKDIVAILPDLKDSIGAV
jgi:hypothetical protein